MTSPISSMEGITIDDTIANMARGWLVVYDDDTQVTESQMDWSEVDKKRIKILALKWYNKFWTIRGKTAYIQMKRGWVPMVVGIDLEPFCEERCIGYYEGKNKVLYRVNDRTGQMTLDVQ